MHERLSGSVSGQHKLEQCAKIFTALKLSQAGHGMLWSKDGIYALNDLDAGRQRCGSYSLFTVHEPERTDKHLADEHTAELAPRILRNRHRGRLQTA